MENLENVSNVADQLMLAFRTALDPKTSNVQRKEAYDLCEAFKEKSELCVPCACYLCSNRGDDAAHVGLQLMEHCVKYRWQRLTVDEKISIKNTVMEMLLKLKGGCGHIPSHLKDGVSRVMVEMIKREWPQNWPELLPTLFDISSKSCPQAEVIFKILSRLVEDVAIFQNMQSAQRRRDIYQALTVEMTSILTFLLNLTEAHYNLAKSSNPGMAGDHILVTKLALETIGNFVEWAPITRIVADNARLLRALCALLAHSEFNVEAADCTLQIIARKLKTDDKRQICAFFFGEEIIATLSALNLAPDGDPLSERSALFAKRFATMISALSFSLCCISGKPEDNLTTSEFFKKNRIREDQYVIFVNAIIALCSHESLVVWEDANLALNTLLKDTTLNKHGSLRSACEAWLRYGIPKTVKPAYPVANEQTTLPLASKYILMEFSSVDCYDLFYHKFKVEITETLKSIHNYCFPDLTFSYFYELLSALIRKSALTTDFSAPDLAQWEIITNIAEIVLTKPANSELSFELPLQKGIELLEMCLQFCPRDHAVASALLTCVSGLVLFVSESPQNVVVAYTPRILDKIFESLLFNVAIDEKQQTPRNIPILTLRRHAAALLIKIASKFPLLLVPFFDQIRSVYEDSRGKGGGLSRMEIIFLLETTVLISNNFNDFAKQSEFLASVATGVRSFWEKLIPSLADYRAFLSFYGLDVEPTGDNMESVRTNRNTLFYSLEVILSIVKRVAVPTDGKVALLGGYVVGGAKRNPATAHVLPYIPSVLSLVKTLNSLWTNEARARLAPSYDGVFAMTIIERKTLIGVAPSEKNEMYVASDSDANSPAGRAQRNLITLYETCLSVLSRSFECLGSAIYEMNDFPQNIASSVFSNFDAIPDFRLRMVIRSFCRSFVCNCPSEKYDSVAPIFGQLTAFMLHKLTKKWQYLTQCRENGSINDDDQECEELLEEIVNLQLTREFTDIVKVALFAGKDANSPGALPENGALADFNASLHISELGTKILLDVNCGQVVLGYILRALVWNDSVNSLKVTGFLLPIAKLWLAEGLMNADIATNSLTALLQSLQVHGEHDCHQGVLVNEAVLMYEMLRPHYPQLLELLKMVPGIVQDDLMRFDSRIVKQEFRTKVDKSRKEMFKKMVAQLIGKNIGQLFKRKESISNLPPLNIYRKKEQPLVDGQNGFDENGFTNIFG